jgi:hypothetical protein
MALHVLKGFVARFSAHPDGQPVDRWVGKTMTARSCACLCPLPTVTYAHGPPPTSQMSVAERRQSFGTRLSRRVPCWKKPLSVTRRSASRWSMRYTRLPSLNPRFVRRCGSGFGTGEGCKQSQFPVSVSGWSSIVAQQFKTDRQTDGALTEECVVFDGSRGASRNVVEWEAKIDSRSRQRRAGLVGTSGALAL